MSLKFEKWEKINVCFGKLVFSNFLFENRFKGSEICHDLIVINHYLRLYSDLQQKLHHITDI
jgi:hypothetical protein